MTYQRNMAIALFLLAEQNIADERLEELIGGVEIRADDRAGDDHDDRALDHLTTAGPLDLLELAPGLPDEAAPLTGLAPAGLGRGGRHTRAHRRRRARALRGGLRRTR